jgi:D-tyrosyl-tRNA(Tyr) deacylase
MTVEGRPVWIHENGSGLRLVFAATSQVPSYLYPAIASELNAFFSDAALVAVVNWHEGANAPSKILCAHTTADIPSAKFGPADAVELSALLRALEQARKEAGLADWRVLAEASHWSGLVAGSRPEELLTVRAPVVDLELGSYAADWSNAEAQKALALAFGKLPSFRAAQAAAFLFCGGAHFEPCVSEALLQSPLSINIGHILPNQWLVSGGYGEPGSEARLVQAPLSHRQPVQAVVFHDGLKGCFKDTIRRMAAAAGLPCFNHRKLRDPAFLQAQLVKEHSNAPVPSA